MLRKFCRGACTSAAAALLLTASATAGPDNVAFPEGYQASFTQYATVNRADDRKQLVKIFANDTALSSAKDGTPLASGSVIAMEVYKAELDGDEQPVTGADGFFVPAELAAVAVMESRAGWGDDYPEEWRNGNWEYAAFGADGNPVERDYQPCFACHKPLHDADYLFSLDALKAHAAD